MHWAAIYGVWTWCKDFRARAKRCWYRVSHVHIKANEHALILSQRCEWASKNLYCQHAKCFFGQLSGVDQQEAEKKSSPYTKESNFASHLTLLREFFIFLMPFISHKFQRHDFSFEIVFYRVYCKERERSESVRILVKCVATTFNRWIRRITLTLHSAKVGCRWVKVKHEE